MLTIDQRKLISLRREEANACIHFGLLHAGTLTACSGIEMLLKTLYDELISKLDKDDQFPAAVVVVNLPLTRTVTIINLNQE